MQDQKARLVRCSKQLFANKGNVYCRALALLERGPRQEYSLKKWRETKSKIYHDSNPSAALALGRAATAAYQSAYYLPPFFS